MALSYGHGSVASHCTYPTVGTYAFLREEGSSPGIWRLRAGQWWRYNHHSYHHYSIITNALTLPLDCDCHLLQSLSVSSPSHTEHLQFCHSTMTHFLLSVTLTLATFLPLSALVLPEWGNLTQGGAFDLNLGQKPITFLWPHYFI